MANKPSFTYMDYKQRIVDELAKLKSSIGGWYRRRNEKNESRVSVGWEDVAYREKNNVRVALRRIEFNREIRDPYKKISGPRGRSANIESSLNIQEGRIVSENAQNVER